MKWRWLAVFLIGLLVVAGGIYLILDPEIHEVNEAARAKWGGTYIRLSDGFTHYRLEGLPGAKVVVLVHGATIPIWTWERQVQALTAAGFRVLSYDAFGRGYSDRPDVVYGQELYAKQLLELTDKLVLISPLINNFKVPSFFGIPILGEFWRVWPVSV